MRVSVCLSVWCLVRLQVSRVSRRRIQERGVDNEVMSKTVWTVRLISVNVQHVWVLT